MMAGLVMALEQSIVMGIALVVLFVQMLNESERTAAAGRALRGRLVRSRHATGFRAGLRPASAEPRAASGRRYAAPGTPSAARPGLRAGQLHFCVPDTVVGLRLAVRGGLAVNVTLYGRLPFLQPTDAL